MTLGDIWTGVTTYGPWIVTGASTLAMMIPPTVVNSNPALKIATAIIDVLALNMNQAKSGPPPLAVFKEVATGDAAPERDELKG